MKTANFKAALAACAVFAGAAHAHAQFADLGKKTYDCVSLGNDLPKVHVLAQAGWPTRVGISVNMSVEVDGIKQNMIGDLAPYNAGFSGSGDAITFQNGTSQGALKIELMSGEYCNRGGCKGGVHHDLKSLPAQIKFANQTAQELVCALL